MNDFRPDGVGTVTQEEKENFTVIKKRLHVLLEHQITNFRFVFPFGRPEGALKSTLTLLEQVKILNCKDVDQILSMHTLYGIIKYISFRMYLVLIVDYNF